MSEGVDVKTRMDRLGHTHDRVNIYSHAGDQAQLARFSHQFLGTGFEDT